jgi:hypothetical protein
MWLRIQAVKAFLKEYLHSNPVDEASQEKIAVVAHSKLIATLTCEGLDDDQKLKNFDWFNNCQMKPFTNF